MAVSPDHAMGLELELGELVKLADEARSWNQTEELARLEAEIARLQEQLAEAAEEVTTAPADPQPATRFNGAVPAAA